MKFKKGLSKELKELLANEFTEYLKVTPMTLEEKESLTNWVSEGNSVFSNGNGTFDEYCKPLTFIEDIRFQQELNTWFNSMTIDEKQSYLQELHHVEEEPIELLLNQKNLHY